MDSGICDNTTAPKIGNAALAAFLKKDRRDNNSSFLSLFSSIVIFLQKKETIAIVMLWQCPRLVDM